MLWLWEHRVLVRGPIERGSKDSWHIFFMPLMSDVHGLHEVEYSYLVVRTEHDMFG